PPPQATPPSSAWGGPSPAPPYSPDLNPIEQVFAKLKHMMRKAAERTFENTWRRAGALLDLFSPDECQNYLSNAGYASI
ncbi:transposase, partial [Methylocella tundrae]